MTTFERFKDVFKRIMTADVTEATTVKSLNLDPLDLYELITGIEEEFKFEIDDVVAENFKTVGDIVTHIDLKLAANEGQ